MEMSEIEEKLDRVQDLMVGLEDIMNQLNDVEESLKQEAEIRNDHIITERYTISESRDYEFREGELVPKPDPVEEGCYEKENIRYSCKCGEEFNEWSEVKRHILSVAGKEVDDEDKS